MRWIVLLAALAALLGCGKGLSVACSDLCTGSGFRGSETNPEPHASICYCSGGAGAVTVSGCTTMCRDIGLSTPSVFARSTGSAFDSCQCH